jgi:hypothetical protein
VPVGILLYRTCHHICRKWAGVCCVKYCYPKWQYLSGDRKDLL